MHRRRAAVLLTLVAVATAACGGDDGAAPSTTAAADPSESLRLNELQVLGSHNSYHQRPDPAVLDGVRLFSDELAAEIDYEHRPLAEQLEDFGIRQLEIDVYADPDGGRFSDRPALEIVGLPTASAEPALEARGMKVLHVADIDFLSSCLTFVACLGEVEAWSSGHPDHLPVTILVEAKRESLAESAASAGVDLSGLGVELTETLPWTRELFDDLEAEILSVFDPERLITPDDVRGDAATLEEAVLAGDAWPTVGESRGKVLFALVDLGETRDTYVGDALSLEGRLLFTSSEEGRADAAFLRIDDSLVEPDRLSAAVEAGYLVRTRADVPGVHAVQGDTTLHESAFASGAQFVSTDYYAEDPALGTGYVVALPGGEVARCNPVTALPDCVAPTD